MRVGAASRPVILERLCRSPAAAVRPTLLRRFGRSLCKRIPETDCFALLHSERRFDLDASGLHTKYKLLMAECHPDRFSRQGEIAVQEASDRASKITDAYTILRYPHRRAVHLLSLLGTPLSEEMSGDALGQAFLMEILDVREELEDAADDAERLAALRQANQSRMDALISELELAFSTSQLEAALQLTAQLQYLQRIEEEIHRCAPVQ